MDRVFERYNIFIFTLQVGRCAPDENLDADAITADTTPTTVAADSTAATTDPNTKAADQSPPTEDGKPSMFSKSKTELYKSLSTFGDGLGMVLKAVGQAALTAIGVLFGTYNSAISVVATTGETLSTGLNLANNVAKRVVLVRDLTGGVSNFASGMSTKFRENTKFTIANREKLFDEMDEKLENHHPETEPYLRSSTTNEGGADGKSTDTTTSAAAPPTNEGSKAADTTATETAPETITPA